MRILSQWRSLSPSSYTNVRDVVVVLSWHEKVFMVQGTRSYNLLCYLVDTCGKFRGTCVCVCVWERERERERESVLGERGVTLWSPSSICVCNKVCWLSTSQRPSPPFPFGVGYYLTVNLGETWWGGGRVHPGRCPSDYGHLHFPDTHWISYCTCLLEYLHIRQIFLRLILI